MYRLRFVYDNVEINFPFCKDNYCKFTEFYDYVNDNLFHDVDGA